jgi:hypothetical protein
MNHRNSTTTTTYGSGNFVTETVELERVHLTSSNAEDIHIHHDAMIDDDDDGDDENYDDYEGDDYDYDHDHDDEYDDGDSSMYCCTRKEYFTSYRFIELNVCFWPCLLIVFYLDYIYYQPRERPIPYEHLGMTGGIGINTESSSTSTINNNDSGNDDEDTSGESIHSYPNIVWNLVNNEKFLGDTISSTECKLYALILPLMLQLFMIWFLWIFPPGSNLVATTTAFNNNNNNNNNNNKPENNNKSIDLGLFHRWDAIHRTICVYSVGFGITEVITCSVKYYVGYLRPIFLDICQPYYDASSSDGEGGVGGGGEFRCTDEYEAKGARISFPSNHAR